MKKKSIALLLVLALVVSLFASCGKKNDAPADSKSPANSDQQTPENQGSNSSSDNNSEETDTNSGSEWSWPLAEKETLKVWKSWDCQWTENPETLKANQAMEQELNIDIEWICPTPTEAKEKFGLLMASGDYPDILLGVEGYYTGGAVQACEDGVILDMTDYIQQYMPNYEALRNSSERLRKDTTTDDGRSVTLYTINTRDGEITGEQPWTGLCLRQDWLNELNMEVPKTIDDWYNVLTAFKTTYNCEAPLMLGSEDALDYTQDFLTAFGVCKDFYQVDGKVHYGPLEDGYRQWVELFRKWYAEGLIDPNFVTNNAMYSPVFEYLGTGRAGASANLYSWTCDYLVSMGIATDEDYWLVAAPSPVLNEGDTPQIAADMGALVGGSISISRDCKNVELACRWLDYCSSTEWMLFSSYGIENETYTKNGDGTYSFLESAKNHIVNDLDYPTFAEGLKSEYCLHNEGLGLYNWYALSVIRQGEPVLEAYDIWDVAKTDMVLPARRSLTAEELTDYNNTYVSLQTLVRENTIKIITGAASMDTYEQFQKDLISYGAQKCIDYQQAALDRYNAR